MWHLVQWHSDIRAGISFQLHLRRNAKSSFEILRLLLHFPRGSALRGRWAASSQKLPRLVLCGWGNVFFKTDKQVKLKQKERRRRWAGGRAGSAGSRAAIVIGSNLLGCIYAQAASDDWQAWKRFRYTYMEAHCVLGVNLCVSGGVGVLVMCVTNKAY